MEALHLVEAFLLRQVTRPIWQIVSMAIIIIVIGNAARGEFRRRIREPALAAWRSHPILASVVLGLMSCVPVLLLGWRQALVVVIYGTSFVRRPVFWLGDRIFDQWTRPLRHHLRRSIRRSKAVRAALRHPRAGIAAVYSAFETLREQRGSKKRLPSHDPDGARPGRSD
jgi:hypothetical protein